MAGPLHVAIDTLLGRAAFVLPLGFALAGAVLIARTVRPGLRLPVRRLFGVSVLLVAVLMAEQLVAGPGEGSGVLGAWLSGTALDLFGAVLTWALVAVGLVAGSLVVFGVRPRMPRHAPTPDQLQAESDAKR